MFLDRVIPSKYLVKQSVCAIEALCEDNGVSYNYIWLKNKGKTIDIVDKGTVVSLSDIPKKILKDKIPVVLILNGKGIVIKKINFSNESNLGISELVKQSLPTINPNEFYIQIFRQEDLSAFICFCRKELIDSFLKELILNKYDVAFVAIGSPSVIGLKPVWSNFNQIPTSTHSIVLTNGNIDSMSGISNEDAKITIEGIELSKTNTLGFANGLSYLIQNGIAENVNPELIQIPIAHQERNKFRALTITSIAVVFVIAITNVIFYTNYFDKNNKLETELSVYQGKYEQINKLLNDYQSKKGLIENAGILNGNKFSEYADKVGATIPEDVVLSNMYFNPKNEDIESEDSLVTFLSKRLIIKGNCNKTFIVNEWVNILKMQKFIKDVSLEKFSYNKEGLTPNFEIKIVTE